MFVCLQRFIRGPRGKGGARENPRGQRPSAKLCTFKKQQQLPDHPLREEIIFKTHLNELRENSAQESE